MDRTFEAAVLADATGLHSRGVFKRAPTFRSFEGSLGKNNRKGVDDLTDLLGRPYNKTKDGPRLFEQLNFTVARDHSAGARGSRSLDKLLRSLGI